MPLLATAGERVGGERGNSGGQGAKGVFLATRFIGSGRKGVSAASTAGQARHDEFAVADQQMGMKGLLLLEWGNAWAQCSSLHSTHGATDLS